LQVNACGAVFFCMHLFLSGRWFLADRGREIHTAPGAIWPLLGGPRLRISCDML